MPVLSPRSLAFDRARGKTYLLAKHGKDVHLLELSTSGALAPIRKLPALSETFWIDPITGHAVFWKINATVIVPLSDAKTKTLKSETTFEQHFAITPEPDALYRVANRSIARFDGAAWTTVDGTAGLPDATMFVASPRGTYRRALAGTPDTWSPVRVFAAPRAVLAALPDGSKLLLASNASNHVLVDPTGERAVPVDLKDTWDVLALDDRFLAWSGRKIHEVALDGTTRDTGVGGEPHADRCLFRAGPVAYFVERTHVHRNDRGSWTTHDIAAAGAAVGLA